jgi:guanyl-specific ribonuclease Sa
MLQNFNRYSYCLNNPLMYVDENGEWFGIDDLIAIAIGGIINVVVHAIQGDIENVGHAFSLFGVGAVAGIATIYTGPVGGGIVMGAGNSTINQGFTVGWSNINWNQVGSGALLGGLTSAVGAQLSSWLSPLTNQLFGNISSPVVQQSVTQGTTNAISGFGVSTGVALLNGATIEDALDAGWIGALSGMAIGVTTGAVSGVRYAHKNGLDPWTGKAIQPIPQELGIQSTLNRIENGETFPHLNDGSVFQNKENILPSADGVTYREYVHPTLGVNGPGAQRIVISSDGHVYYTPDHYKTFLKIK